jgi:hypothetical protein
MLGHSIVSQHFMEPEGSIPNSQELSTCSYPEPDQPSPHGILIVLVDAFHGFQSPRQTPEFYLKLGHDHFFPHNFQFIILCDPVMQSCI